MLNRFILLLKQIAPAILVGVVLLLLAIFGKGIPCVFYLITGLQCPGCGATRMILALLHFDIKAAFGYNSGLMITLPILGLVLSVSLWRYLRGKTWELLPWQTVVIYIILILLLVFSVLRNII